MQRGYLFTLRTAAIFLIAPSAACTPQIADAAIDAFAGSFGETVTVPEYDATPPVVTLEIPDLGSGPIVLGSGDPSVSLDLELGQRFFVVGVAEDPEGVKSVEFFGTSTRSCSSPDSPLASISHATLVGPSSVDDAVPGETALTRRWQPTLITDAYGCGPGLEGYYSVTLGVRAKNFADMESTTGLAGFGYDFEG